MTIINQSRCLRKTLIIDLDLRRLTYQSFISRQLIFGGTTSASSQMLKAFPSPRENVQFPLIWPIFRSLCQTSANGIFNDVLPLFLIAFTPSKLGVPKVTLPNWKPFWAGRIPCDVGFPKTYPFRERLDGQNSRRAKQMNVIRHNHVTADKPRRVRRPGVQRKIADRTRREN